LTGGIGSGKSHVASLFRRMGAHVVDADRIAHRLLTRPEIRRILVRWWGREILTRGGRIDRRQVARRVFDSPKERNRLAGMMHPRIQKEMERLVKRSRRKIVVLDAPLLLEKGMDALCDRVLFLDVPLCERRNRVARTRGWSEPELEAREKAQMPISEKRRRADIVLRNVGPGLERRLKRLVRKFAGDGCAPNVS
jgi:dephospho-CoA kinase